MPFPSVSSPPSSGLTSPVTTDPLTFSGAVTFSKEIAVNNSTSNSIFTGATAAQKVLVAKGAASQSGNIFEAQTSAGAGTGIAIASSAAQLTFPTGTTSAVGLLFGGDTNLYRSAASTLATDSILKITGGGTAANSITLTWGNTPFSGGQISFGSADLQVGRMAGGVLGVTIGTGAAAMSAPTMAGVGLMLANVSAAPSTNPSGGGVLYCEAGALKYRGTGGTVTVLGAA